MFCLVSVQTSMFKSIFYLHFIMKRKAEKKIIRQKNILVWQSAEN